MSPTQGTTPNVLIISISSDIGTQLALHYLEQGATVVGTFRTTYPDVFRGNPAVKLLQCDVTQTESASALSSFLESTGLRWDIFISCVGQLAPIGLFFDTDFEDWNDSINVNSTAQLRALHAAYPFRRVGQICHTVFFAGGGTNNPFRSYSAYCLGKIALIKMCELIDDEAPDLNAFIVGTGWVRTKIHKQTLAAGTNAGGNQGTTAAFLNDPGKGTSFEDIAAMIDWAVSKGRAITGGRNFSIVHDPWRDGGAALVAALSADKEMFKLRRHGNSGNISR